MTSVESILGDAGPIATLLGDGYEPRDHQIAMSRAVERTFEDLSLIHI